MTEAPRLPRRSRRDEGPRNAATLLALLGLVFATFGLLALTSLVLPQARAILLIVGGFSAFIGLHYFTWGRWMSRMRKNSLPEDENSFSAVDPSPGGLFPGGEDLNEPWEEDERRVD